MLCGYMIYDIYNIYIYVIYIYDIYIYIMYMIYIYIYTYTCTPWCSWMDVDFLRLSNLKMRDTISQAGDCQYDVDGKLKSGINSPVEVGS